jgi:hypothetical protein
VRVSCCFFLDEATSASRSSSNIWPSTPYTAKHRWCENAFTVGKCDASALQVKRNCSTNTLSFVGTRSRPPDTWFRRSDMPKRRRARQVIHEPEATYVCFCLRQHCCRLDAAMRNGLAQWRPHGATFPGTIHASSRLEQRAHDCRVVVACRNVQGRPRAP